MIRIVLALPHVGEGLGGGREGLHFISLISFPCMGLGGGREGTAGIQTFYIPKLYCKVIFLGGMISPGRPIYSLLNIFLMMKAIFEALVN